MSFDLVVRSSCRVGLNLVIAATCALVGASVSSSAAAREQRWTSPFQAGRPALTSSRWITLGAERCDRSDPYAKCSFTVRIDYNADGRLDLARMVESAGVSAIVVDFGGSKGKPLVVATFRNRWNGSCYISADRNDRSAIVLTCPEASAALFKLRNGRPAALWLAD